MAEKSKIEWCDHTFNPWIGCTKVSPGCLNCYAETQNNLRKWNPAGWGKGVPRKRTKTWGEPVKWNGAADPKLQTIFGDAPRRPRVFCASLADWLDDEVPVEWLRDLLYLIYTTPDLDWLLLTKRPENFRRRLADVGALNGRDGSPNGDANFAAMIYCWAGPQSHYPHNVWVGTTVEDQQRANERIPHLLGIPARVRFLSCEPLLGPVDLTAIPLSSDPKMKVNALCGHVTGMDEFGERVHWIIAGGESGPGARPMHPDWARSLRDQCQAAGVPFLFKQWGEWSPTSPGGDPKRCEIKPDGALVKNRAQGFGCDLYRVGKKAAGRELDGRTWDEFPDGLEVTDG